MPRIRRTAARVGARAAAVLIALAALAWPQPARADLWYEHYARAEQALAEKDWRRAVTELQRALERRGDSARSVRSYGMKVIDYFPYARLGVAYYHLGEHEAALQAFDTEERLGAVRGSREALAEIGRFRALAEAERVQTAALRRQRAAAASAEGVKNAQALAAAGRLAEAVTALDRVVAVDPGNPEAADLLVRLRARLLEQTRAREAEVEAAALLARGRELLERQAWDEASSVLRRALALRPSAEASEALAWAQDGLRASLAAGGGTPMQAILAEAERLAAAGDLDGALARLEQALISAPEDERALAVQRRLLAARDAGERQRALGTALADAAQAWTSRRVEDVLAAANRALALDAGNADALEHIRRAYREISRALTGDSAGNIPPAIRFADLRESLSDGSRTERLRTPEFRLSGVVIDASPVVVTLHDEAGRALPATVRSEPVGELVVTEFVLARRLAPGAAVVRVTATDDGGLSSSSEYAAVYERPAWRSPWLFGLALVAPPLAVAAVALRRRRRRNELLRRRFNPFVAGAPVLDEAVFVGRDRLLERILQTIHNNSLLLYGERRIGKTSIQHHLRRRLLALRDPEYRFVPVLVDLQGVAEERFFATLGEEVVAEVGRLVGGLEWREPTEGPYGHRELIADLRRSLAALEPGDGRKVKLVLLIDEVDELNDYDPRTNQKLRSLFMKTFADSLVAVVSGVEIRKQWEKEGSPWYNFFEEIEIGPITEEAARELVERPLRGVLRLAPGVTDRIIAACGCRPYPIQRLCVALVNRAHEHGRRVVTVEDVEALAGGAV